MYLDFGENEEETIILDLIVRSSDTEQKMISVYQKNAGITPVFPIILTNKGTDELTRLFGTQGQGKPTWIVHPGREYQKTSYIEPDMTDDLTAAVNDTCNATNIHTASCDHSKAIRFKSANDRNLILFSTSSKSISLQLITCNGKLIYSADSYLSPGKNRIVFSKEEGRKGLYILGRKEVSGFQFFKKVLIK